MYDYTITILRNSDPKSSDQTPPLTIKLTASSDRGARLKGEVFRKAVGGSIWKIVKNGSITVPSVKRNNIIRSGSLPSDSTPSDSPKSSKKRSRKTKEKTSRVIASSPLTCIN